MSDFLSEQIESDCCEANFSLSTELIKSVMTIMTNIVLQRQKTEDIRKASM